MTIVYNGGTEIGGDGSRHYVVGPVPEGSQMVLVCRVLGGKDIYRIFFFQNLKFSSCLLSLKSTRVLRNASSLIRL